MKKLVLAVSIVAASAVSASAADMAVKARPMVAPIYDWSGFYAGVNAGGVWNDTRDDLFPTGCFLTNIACGGGIPNNPQRSDLGRMHGSSFTGGGQAGYNWQSGKWVFGVEGDIEYVGINDSNVINRPIAAPLVGNFLHTETDKQDWLATVRGRVGVTLDPSFLVFATGGVAFGEVRSATAVAFTTTTDAYAGSTSTTRVGWTVGGGGEWMFAPKWSIKAEYLYVDLGKAGYNNACITAVCAGFAPPPSYQTDLRVHEHVARVGLNYHFSGPVVARY
jgi:outer membrane immunogenic protein